MTDKRVNETGGTFVIDRDPARGGQVMVASTGLDQTVKTEIKENYGELIVQSKKGTCCGVCPLKDGRYAIAFAYKVGASKKEFRTHEMIRGVVVEEKKLAEICPYFASGQLEKLFFPEEEPDPDYPEDWSFDWKLLEQEKTDFNNSNCIESEIFNGLSRAFKEMKKNGWKIQLSVPGDMRMAAMALLVSTALQNHVRFFLMADGECTLRDPNIVVLDQLDYMNARKYHKMTLEGLLRWGNNPRKNRSGSSVKNHEKREQKEEKIHALVNLCRAYVLEAGVTAYELQERIQEFHDTCGSIAYESFLRRLRSELYQFQVETMCCQESFMELLYMSFYRSHTGKNTPPGLEVQMFYDYTGMLYFFKKKARNKRELKKLTAAMLEFQFDACLTEMNKKLIHKETMNALKK